jgi:hypothetical protein
MAIHNLNNSVLYFQPGDVCYDIGTNERGTVIAHTGDGLVFVLMGQCVRRYEPRQLRRKHGFSGVLRKVVTRG